MKADGLAARSPSHETSKYSDTPHRNTKSRIYFSLFFCQSYDLYAYLASTPMSVSLSYHFCGPYRTNDHVGFGFAVHITNHVVFNNCMPPLVVKEINK